MTASEPAVDSRKDYSHRSAVYVAVLLSVNDSWGHCISSYHHLLQSALVVGCYGENGRWGGGGGGGGHVSLVICPSVGPRPHAYL